MQRLYTSARHRLRPETRAVYDEEDAAQSAFNSFCTAIAAGRFPDLHDREGLWRLLLVITARKVTHRHRFDQQQRRDIRRNATHRIFLARQGEPAAAGISQLPSREPTPEFAAEFADVCEKLLSDLNDPRLQEVALLRMEGLADSEIGDRLRCSRSTVQRRLEVIRRHCQQLERCDE